MFISNLWFFKDGEKYFSLNMLHQQLKFVPPLNPQALSTNSA